MNFLLLFHQSAISLFSEKVYQFFVFLLVQYIIRIGLPLFISQGVRPSSVGKLNPNGFTFLFDLFSPLLIYFAAYTLHLLVTLEIGL